MKRIKNFLKKIVLQDPCPTKLARSLCVGNYIAFSPYLGLHTVMVFIACWIWNLNLALTMTTSYFVNNLWTAIPIYVTDYLFGYWLINTVIPIERYLYTPAWLESAEQYIHAKLNIPIPCFWSFMIGGNILGILTSMALYPFCIWLFTVMLKTRNQPQQTKGV